MHTVLRAVVPERGCPVSEKLSPERAVRLLRAKAAELEAQVRHDYDQGVGLVSRVTGLTADVALIAGLLADLIERSEVPDE